MIQYGCNRKATCCPSYSGRHILKRRITMYLEKINSPSDIKKLSVDEMKKLTQEMRDALIFKLSRHGGHCGPNLGFAEATVALHYVFDSPTDKIVFDVSHQTYCHKMLTGRKDGFLYEEHFDDISGYSNPAESEHDFFVIGHTSTSVSLALGLAKARDLKHESGNVIAVIGDGSLSGGEALEAIDYAGEFDGNLIVIINDNDMSIAENHGGMYKNLKALREGNGKADTNLFTAMGLDYVFVKDGNNIESLIAAFSKVKDSKRPVAVHIVTEKGKGLSFAEENKEDWHWHMPFDVETGKAKYNYDGEDYGDLTAKMLLEKMKKDESVCVLTSGTPTVGGFWKGRRDEAGRQFIDVGIAEENAAAMASGIAAGGGKPLYTVYSTFIQRTYDQISQDICINNSPVAISVFAGSVYGMSDVTHLGLYDIPMLSNIPNLVYLAPATKEEYLSMLDWAIEQNKYPVAVRVPGGAVISDGKEVKSDWSDINKYEITKSGSRIAVIALGTFYQLGEKAAKLIEEKTGTAPTLISPHYITGIDKEMLEDLKKNHNVVITLEDGILEGGFGEKIARFYGSSDVKTLCFGLEKKFYDRYDVNELMHQAHLTPEQIAEDTIALLK